MMDYYIAANDLFVSKYFKNYKLLNVMTLNKSSCFNSAWNSIAKPLKTKYEYFADKQEWKAILNFVSGVKY